MSMAILHTNRLRKKAKVRAKKWQKNGLFYSTSAYWNCVVLPTRAYWNCVAYSGLLEMVRIEFRALEMLVKERRNRLILPLDHGSGNDVSTAFPPRGGIERSLRTVVYVGCIAGLSRGKSVSATVVCRAA